MAFPTIPTSAAGRIVSSLNTSPAGTHTFPNLNTLTAPAGTLIIAICIIYDGNSTNAEFSSWGASFNEFVDQATTATMGIGAAYKWSGGSETGTFTVTSADTSTNDSACILLAIPGAHASTPPEGGTITNGTSAAADIAALNPAGWDVEDTLWIAVCGSGEISTTSTWLGATVAPANYTDYFDTGVSADVAGAVEGAVAFRQLAAASDDPGAFTVDLTNARNSALLLAVRPAAVTDANAESVAITATSEAPTAEIAPNAEGVAITAAALDATVSTEAPGTNAQAECAEATVTAEAPSASIDPNAEGVAVTATAEAASTSIDPNAEVVGVAVSSETPAASIDPNAEAVGVTASVDNPAAGVDVNAEGVAITAAAENATVETTGATNAPAECATATAEVGAARGDISASAEVAGITVSAETAAAALDVLAEAIAIVVAALDADGQGDDPIGWSTPYTSATANPVYDTRTTPGTYAASTTRGVL